MRVRAVSCLLPPAAAAAARLLVAVVGAAAVGCGEPTAPPAGAQPISPPPPVYQIWWNDVERCSGMTGELTRVDWYQVPCAAGETGFACPDAPDGLCGGQWRSPHLISLAGPNRVLPAGYVDDEFTVKHEMLHDLTGSPEHGQAFKDCHLLFR